MNRTDSIVKEYIDLPYSDFEAENTIGELVDGRLFIVILDNTVFVSIKPLTLSELKDNFYNLDDETLNDYIEHNYVELSEDTLELFEKILAETGRTKK